MMVLFAGVAGPRQLDGAAMDELERVRGIAGANVADDLRRGRGVRAIIASTSGLSDRFSPRWRGGCCVGKAFFDCILLDPGPDADLERRRGCAPPAGTGGRVFSACLGVLGCEASAAGGVRGVLGRRGRGAEPKTAEDIVGLWGERMSEMRGEAAAMAAGREEEKAVHEARAPACEVGEATEGRI